MMMQGTGVYVGHMSDSTSHNFRNTLYLGGFEVQPKTAELVGKDCKITRTHRSKLKMELCFHAINLSGECNQSSKGFDSPPPQFSVAPT